MMRKLFESGHGGGLHDLELRHGRRGVEQEGGPRPGQFPCFVFPLFLCFKLPVNSA
jgi:hypothetical protein